MTEQRRYNSGTALRTALEERLKRIALEYPPHFHQACAEPATERRPAKAEPDSRGAAEPVRSDS